MTAEDFKNYLQEKIEEAAQKEKDKKGVIINDDTHDWGGCESHYIKQDLV